MCAEHLLEGRMKKVHSYNILKKLRPTFNIMCIDSKYSGQIVSILCNLAFQILTFCHEWM